MTEIKRGLNIRFVETFGPKKATQYFSPGRINLIDERTDYSGDHVFPVSIAYETQGVVVPRDDSKILVYSTNSDDIGVINFTLDELEYGKKADWANYVKRMVLKLKEAGHSISHGFELVVEGTIPNNARLFNSASLELLVGVVLEDLFDLKTDRLELVQTGRKIENEFIDVNSGIMDQFTIGFGEPDHTILLDANTPEYEMVPVKLDGYATAIMNTSKRWELADSKYSGHHSECGEALTRLQKILPISSLGGLDEEEFESTINRVSDDILIRRARHAVSENQRTLKAEAELEAGDLETFGQLLNDSHHSLHYDYEVTGIKLDTLVDVAQKQEGALGAQMTGAGFSDCAIAFIKEEDISVFKNNVHDGYMKVVGYAPEFCVAHVGNGTTEIDPEVVHV